MDTNQDIENIIKLLDGLTEQGDGRIKLRVENQEESSRVYHHGRCDIGSPFACGTAFDVLE